jgi:hypothetical protein
MNDPIPPPDEKQSRREACRNLLRYSLLGGIGLLWAGLYIRSVQNTAPNPCAQFPSCGGCTLLEKCNLPQADNTRDGKKSN